MNIITLFYFALMTLVLSYCQTSPKTTLKYCSFFNNRSPRAEPNLKNCTWFRENSCCRQSEVSTVFDSVKPLRGASPSCQRYTNYLMCYICSPDQYLFYFRERLTVCEEFCDAWYAACKSAIFRSSVIEELFSNGKEYCLSQRFKVDARGNGRCFDYDPKLHFSGAENHTIDFTVDSEVTKNNTINPKSDTRGAANHAIVHQSLFAFPSVFLSIFRIFEVR